MRGLLVPLAALLLALPMYGEPGSTLRVEFTNPGLTPSNWTLVIHPDGSAHFHSDRGAAALPPEAIWEPRTVDRDVRLSDQYVDHVFDIVHQHRLLAGGCESHLKVAFQGWKKLTYTGPDGNGQCEFNYSKDKDIQAMGDSFVAVATTIVEGARLELLLQHDPLGLDKEMQYVKEASNDGRLQQIGTIRGILQRLEEDPDIMERVRRQAQMLLAKSQN